MLASSRKLVVTPSLQEIQQEIDRRRFKKYPDLWIERNFYEPDTVGLIKLMEYQRACLRYAALRNEDGTLRFRTVIWSQRKKSGKTAISGAWGRWAAETWGPYQLVLYAGNDAQQARERGFAALSKSIEMTPGYDIKQRVLPDRWRLLDNEARAYNGSRVKAIPVDAIGEAGANPSLVVFTELWGFIHTAAKRFWAEMAPSPTRLNSMRWVETYAGFQGESELLWGLYESAVLGGRQLTAGEMAEATGTQVGAFHEAPNADDPIPCYVNEQAGIFCLWDDGPAGARMPWQQGERGASYYANEKATQTATEYRRIHEDEWVSAESAFIPIEWWDNCAGELSPLRAGDPTPIVIALDAAVTSDCFGMVAVSRAPNSPKDSVALRLSRKWTPPPGGAIDFDGPRHLLKEWVKAYNVVEVAYDPYQLHDFAQQLRNDPEFLAWLRPFPQMQDRLKADKALFDMIRDRRVRHDGTHSDMREHLTNANAKTGATEDSKLRITKKSEKLKIDLAVCLSMGSSECLRLMLV